MIIQTGSVAKPMRVLERNHFSLGITPSIDTAALAECVNHFETTFFGN